MHALTKADKRKHKSQKPKQVNHPQQSKSESKIPSAPMIQCKFCAKTHPRKKELCPAWGKQCSKCKTLNHFAVCCPPAKKVHGISYDSDDSFTMCVTDDTHVNSVNAGAIYANILRCHYY